MVCTTINVKRLSRVGSGSSGYVWRATSDIEGAKIIALKQSRASLQLKRPLIEYEACIIQYLRGHPSIPKLYAYGRQKHFEFLALELLGPSLGDLGNRFSIGTVLKVANQMLSSLSYIHNLGIVHRDIKPNNILLSLDNPDQLKVVDFGLARSIDSSESKRSGVDGGYVGTLAWASINSHEGFQLSRRDDLESLAYILLAFLRGDLPWRHYARYSVFNSIRQVYEKKRSWTGARLGVGLSPPFGKFLDYARGLLFNEVPDYEGWTVTFKHLAKIGGYDDHRSFDWTVQEMPSNPLKTSAGLLTPPSDFPVEKGQLVYVRVLARPTLEEFRPFIRDPSYWHEPDLTNAPSLDMGTIPGIVVETFVHDGGLLGIYVLPIRRGGAPPEVLKDRATKIVGDCSSKSDHDCIVLPDWPFDDTYCFAWPYPAKFALPLDSDLQVSVHWKIPAETTNNLYEKYTSICSNSHKFRPERLWNLSPRHKIFARVLPLTPQTLQVSEGFDTTWTAEKGWYDDLAKICKRITNDRGFLWDSEKLSGENELTDSFSPDAGTGWLDRQRQERDSSLTFEESYEETFARIKSEIVKVQLVVE